MNSFFYKLYLPYLFLSLVGIVLAFFDPYLLLWTLLFWVLLGPIGLGLGFHRLFSHRQFITYRPIEFILAFLGTISAFGPLLFWVSSHQAHHKYTDTDKDPTAPRRGFWHSAMTWNLKKECENEISLKSKGPISVLKDPALMFFSNNFYVINYTFLAILLLLNFKIALVGYVLGTLIEKIRIGLFVNYLLHSNLPGTYKVTDKSDNSKNFILYPLTMGFSLHNAHHSHPMSLSEKRKWFEINLEYYICKAITKND